MTTADKSGRSDERTVEEEIIPVVEERVRTSTVGTEGRTVTVHSRPVTETVTLSQPVMRENVSIERIPVGKVVTEMPPIREEGEVTVIPVVEEQLRVVVDLVLTEEIHLRRVREETSEVFEVERRRTEIDISVED